MRFSLTCATNIRVGGIRQPNALIGSYPVGKAFYCAHNRKPLPGAVPLNDCTRSTVPRVL